VRKSGSTTVRLLSVCCPLAYASYKCEFCVQATITSSVARFRCSIVGHSDHPFEATAENLMKPSGRGLHKLAIAKIFPNKEMYKLRIGEILKHTRACFNTMQVKRWKRQFAVTTKNGNHFKQGKPCLGRRFGGLETVFSGMLRQNIPDLEFDENTVYCV
jgi:hypothetical protein